MQNVDRLWWAWQNKNKAANFWAFEGGSVASPDLFNPDNQYVPVASFVTGAFLLLTL